MFLENNTIAKILDVILKLSFYIDRDSISSR